MLLGNTEVCTISPNAQNREVKPHKNKSIHPDQERCSWKVPSLVLSRNWSLLCFSQSRFNLQSVHECDVVVDPLRFCQTDVESGGGEVRREDKA